MASVTLGIPINFFATSTALRILGSKRTPSERRNTIDGEVMMVVVDPIDFAWQIELVILGGIGLWTFFAYIISQIIPMVKENPTELQLSMIGNICCATGLIFYISPLSTLVEIVRNKDGSSLHTPTILLNLMATILWSSYGLFYMEDVNVYAPNLVAVCLSLSQLGIKFYYPSGTMKKFDDKYRHAMVEEGLNPLHHEADPSGPANEYHVTVVTVIDQLSNSGPLDMEMAQEVGASAGPPSHSEDTEKSYPDVDIITIQANVPTYRRLSSPVPPSQSLFTHTISAPSLMTFHTEPLLDCEQQAAHEEPPSIGLEDLGLRSRSNTTGFMF
jgi:uncharacterized protein with PQ loop repeat